MSQAHRIAGELHVRTSTRDVIKHASSKLCKEHRSSREVRDARHKFYREVLQTHEDNRHVFDSYRF